MTGCGRGWRLAMPPGELPACRAPHGGGQRAGATHHSDAARLWVSFCGGPGMLPDDTFSLPPVSLDHPLTPPPVVPEVRPCAALPLRNPEAATFCAACGMRLRHPCPLWARISFCRRRSARPVGSLASSHLLQSLLPPWPRLPSLLRPCDAS